MEILQEIQKFLQSVKRPLIVILGPTASGKTALSLKLAHTLNNVQPQRRHCEISNAEWRPTESVETDSVMIEIISADSRQIYKGLNVTAEILSESEREGIPHHLLAFRNPDQTFSVGEFVQTAEQLIEEIYSRRRLPMIVGGTGLYIRALTQNFQIPRVEANPTYRRNLEKIAREQGTMALFMQLQKVDPEAAKKIHPNNLRYIVRALEINHFTAQQKLDEKSEPKYDVFKIGIARPREVLYERINERVHRQIERGAIDEVKKLLAHGYDSKLPALSSLGCRELIQYINGEISLEKAVELIQQHTRNYARQQMVWFRKEPGVRWIAPDHSENFCA